MSDLSKLASNELKVLSGGNNQVKHKDTRPSWYLRLQDQNELNLNGYGKVQKRSMVNIAAIVENMPLTKGLLKYNEFTNQRIFSRDAKPLGAYKDAIAMKESSKLLAYEIEQSTGVLFDSKLIDDTLTVVAQKNSFNPVKEWIESEPWDGKERAETLLIDNLGAEDNGYTREVTRKVLLELVSRIYKPGCKADLVLILQGKQGIGKSMLLSKLAPTPEYFNDSIKSIGRSAEEDGRAIVGKLVIEFGELSAMKGSNIEVVKQYITSRVDQYRDIYERQATPHPRKCIFVGSTNETEFLKDRTGNRRFCPVSCKNQKCVVNQDKHYYQQVIAEVKQRWFDTGEKPVLSELAAKEQERLTNVAMNENPFDMLVDDYLAMEVPENWDTMDKISKRNYFLYWKDPDDSRLTLDYRQQLKRYRESGKLKKIDKFTNQEAIYVIFGIDYKINPGEYQKKSKIYNSIMQKHSEFKPYRENTRGYVRKNKKVSQKGCQGVVDK